jgi:pyridoxal 5'-phosphate synthase pdxT subunit
MAVGILALQGAFAEHAAVLDRLQVPHFEIRQKRDLSQPMDRLILPGGESTVMRKLLTELELLEPLKQRITDGMPVLGTCAGLILLAKQVDGGKPCFATMDISVKRNAYGRQLGSFHTEQPFETLGVLPMTFIRAPYIASVEGDTQILATVDGNIVAARQGNQLVTAFHPELDDNTAIHEYFLQMQ